MSAVGEPVAGRRAGPLVRVVEYIGDRVISVCPFRYQS